MHPDGLGLLLQASHDRVMATVAPSAMVSIKRRAKRNSQFRSVCRHYAGCKSCSAHAPSVDEPAGAAQLGCEADFLRSFVYSRCKLKQRRQYSVTCSYGDPPFGGSE